MALLQAGILGGISGKVGNVVGGSWKGKDWIRIHKIPTMSQEAGPVAARAAMGFLIPFGKYNNETLLKDTFAHVTKGKPLSPFNRFISVNNKDRNPETDFASTRWSEGVVQPAPISGATYSESTNEIDFTFDPNVDGYGSGDDIVAVFVSSPADPAVDIVQPFSDAVKRSGMVARVGTGMYKILASNKDGGATAPCYLHVVCKNAAGEVSETSTTPLTFVE